MIWMAILFNLFYFILLCQATPYTTGSSGVFLPSSQMTSNPMLRADPTSILQTLSKGSRYSRCTQRVVNGSECGTVHAIEHQLHDAAGASARCTHLEVRIFVLDLRNGVDLLQRNLADDLFPRRGRALLDPCCFLQEISSGLRVQCAPRLSETRTWQRTQEVMGWSA